MVSVKRKAGMGLWAAILLLGGCVIQFSAHDDYDETFGFEGFSSVRIVNVDGDMSLRGMETGDVKLCGTRFAMGRTDADARANLRLARLDVSPDLTDLTLEFDPPRDKVGLVDLRLDRLSTLPREAGVIVAVEDGDLAIEDLEGVLMLETGKGDISVIGGGTSTIRAVADDGDVSVEANGEIIVESGGQAKVLAGGVDGRPLNVETDGELLHIEIPLQDFEISCYPDGGNIEIEASLEAGSAQELGDGLIRYVRGNGAKKITLRSNGGPILIQLYQQ